MLDQEQLTFEPKEKQAEHLEKVAFASVALADAEGLDVALNKRNLAGDDYFSFGAPTI